MRGLLTQLLVGAILSIGVSAQDTVSAGVPASSASTPGSNTSMGFKVLYGWGLPSYEGVNLESETSAAWSVGAFWNWSTAGAVSFAIQPELHYVQESGISVASLINDLTIETTTTVSSVRLPVLFKLQLFDRMIIQPSIYAGPAFSYLLSAKNETNGQSVDIEDPTKFQVGLALGADVTVLEIFVLDIRYNTKFTKITEVTLNGVTSSASMNSLRVGLGLRF